MKLTGRIKSESGFTLMEVVMSMALSVLVVAAIHTFYVNSNQRIKEIGDEIESSTEIEAGQRILLRDLKSIDPSYAALTLLDDENRPFFEYFPDVADRTLAAKAPTRRTLTMKWNGGLKEIVFLMHDPTAHEIPSLTYDPLDAFTVGQSPNINTPGPVNFRGVNFLNSISSTRPVIKDSSNRTVYPGYWVTHQLLMFDTPISFREQGTTDLASVAPRPPFFIGKVDTGATPAAALSALPTNFDLGGAARIHVKHPIWPNSSAQNMISVENFLRFLPAAGGGQPMVRVRPVRLVKYYIELMYPSAKDQTDPKKKDLVKLYRQMLSKGKWENKTATKAGEKLFIVAEGLKSVQFVRKTITEKAITFDISRSELKKGGEI